MKKLAYIILIECYADWELGFLAPMFHEEGSADATWQAQTVSLTSEPIRSMGGLTVTPDLGLYNGQANFDPVARVVVDKNIITADGAFPLEFTEAVLKTLQVLPDEEIDGWRESFRVGEKEYWGG